MDLPGWLVASIVASVVLTVVANLVLRWRPTTQRRLDGGLRDLADRVDPEPPHAGDRRRRVRVFVPWKLMIVASLGLTILLNLLLALGR